MSTADLASLPAVLTLKQAAAAVGRTERTIRRWIKKGRLPRIAHGQPLIRRDDLLRAEREEQEART